MVSAGHFYLKVTTYRTLVITRLNKMNLCRPSAQIGLGAYIYMDLQNRQDQLNTEFAKDSTKYIMRHRYKR